MWSNLKLIISKKEAPRMNHAEPRSKEFWISPESDLTVLGAEAQLSHRHGHAGNHPTSENFYL
jgi:hypothetical protein